MSIANDPHTGPSCLDKEEGDTALRAELDEMSSLSGRVRMEHAVVSEHADRVPNRRDHMG